jgi:septum site-determining protein MinC
MADEQGQDEPQNQNAVPSDDEAIEQKKAEAEQARKIKAKRQLCTIRQEGANLQVSFDKESEFKHVFAALSKEVKAQPLFFNNKVVFVEHTVKGFSPKHKGMLRRLAQKYDFIWQDATRSIKDDGTQANCILYPRSMRSGQKIEYEGHVVVMGDVHPTAEVIAGGSIVIWGEIKGVVHAGAGGDEQAVIVGLLFEPTQIRIADCMVMNEESDIQEGNDVERPQREFYPQVAYLRGDEIVLKNWEKGSLFPSVFGKVLRETPLIDTE